jgi:hypothetical protein
LTRDTSDRTYHGVTQTDAPKRDTASSSPSSGPGASGSGGPSGARDAREEKRASATGDASEARESKSEAKSDAKSDAKKERVLHTRVPAVLERELKRFADNLRVPVSNLVRTILEDALSVADAATESVEGRLRKAAEHLEKEREKLKKRMEHDPLAGIVAFQEVTLAVPAACAKCAETIPRGSKAHLGIGDGSDERVFVCETCRPRG